MNLFTRRTRRAVALAAAAAVVLPLSAATTANAQVKRSADTTSYTSAKYLQSTLGLPNKPKLVIESVTYDRFQWLLRQDGKFAFLIGDPATDPSFAGRAQDVEAVATDAGVKRVYWFNPNLSGNAKVGPVTLPNLDIRDPAGITSLAPRSRTVFHTAWLRLIADHLGNGASTAPANVASGAVISATTGTATVNDYGKNAGFSTKVGDVNGGALYDYSTGTPADVKDSFFFIYDKDNTVTTPGSTQAPAKIGAWVNLTKQASSGAAQTAIAAAIAACGADLIRDLSEFAWWKDSNNTKQAQGSNPWNGSEIPTLTDADAAEDKGGWRVHQITYPELVFLLKTEQTKDVVLLFGGTWCPNTRPVLGKINQYARENDVTVFNWDTILDGGEVGSGNNARNPLQSRGPAAFTPSGGSLIENSNPSWLYGEVVDRYLRNLKTEYKADAGNRITYFPGGDTTKPLESEPRLQVPYLFGYRGQATDEPFGGVNRQWIYQKPTPGTDGSTEYVEYMTTWQFANPQPDQLGVSASDVLRQTPAWSTVNTQLASITDATDPSSLYPNTGIDTDAAQFLTATDTATVTFTAPSSVSVSSGGGSAISVNPTALSAALAALGSTAPTNNAAARTAFIEAKTAPTPDPTLISRLEVVVGAWGLSQQRKDRIIRLWGNDASPGSVFGARKALRDAKAFFEGLPSKSGGPTPTPTPDPTPTPTPLAPSGPAGPSTGGTGSTTPTATKVRVSRVTGSVSKAQTRKARGRYTVRITTPRGSAAATGQVTITLKKGRTTRTVRGTLRRGVATVTLPKLARGTWKVTIAWPGNTTYRAASASGASVKVR